VLFLDDDVLADPDLIDVHLACHEARSYDGAGNVVIGYILPYERPEAIHREMRLWWLDHYRRLQQNGATFTAFYTGNASVPREAALRAGGFDESLDYGEDVEFGYRLSLLGLQFIYEPRACVHTENLKSGTDLLRDMQRIGRGSARIYRKFPQTLPALPLSSYGETSLRMRMVRGLLLKIGQHGLGERLIDKAFSLWAEKHRASRLDRQAFELARSYHFWLGVRAEIENPEEWSKLTSAGVPVLVYHSLAPSNENADLYTIDKKRYSRQMRLLHLLGYNVLPLENIVETWERGDLPPACSIAVTFDDGYVNNMRYAWPLMRKFGYPATLFFVGGLEGKTNVWDQNGEDGTKPLLKYSQLRALDSTGFRPEAHTVTHPDLVTLSPQEAADEIERSKVQLEANLGRPVRLFAYPYGHHNPCLERVVENAGYKAAFTVERGLNTLRTPRFALKRVTISGDDNLLMFALKVYTGDDPLRYVPFVRQMIDRKGTRKRKPHTRKAT
jgi:peptidoglycan/xylan/chitin deacetylase (PgdA/CDA1 family)